MSTCSLDLPSLTNVTIGEQSLKGIEKGQSSLSIVGMNRILLLVIDCPQLSFFSGMECFWFMEKVLVQNLPQSTEVSLIDAFKNIGAIDNHGSSYYYTSLIDGGALGQYIEEQLELANAEVLLRYMTATVQSFEDWQALASNIESITVISNSCNDPKVKTLDFARLPQLVNIMINDQCFRYVEKVVFSGMDRLSRITVGVSCFAENPFHGQLNKNRSLTIKNCPVLNEINVSRFSFSDYYSFTLTNVPQLQSLLIGDGDASNNFQFCPTLHLIDLFKLQSIEFGSGCFMNASSIRFESTSDKWL